MITEGFLVRHYQGAAGARDAAQLDVTQDHLLMVGSPACNGPATPPKSASDNQRSKRTEVNRFGGFVRTQPSQRRAENVDRGRHGPRWGHMSVGWRWMLTDLAWPQVGRHNSPAHSAGTRGVDARAAGSGPAGWAQPALVMVSRVKVLRGVDGRCARRARALAGLRAIPKKHAFVVALVCEGSGRAGI